MSEATEQVVEKIGDKIVGYMDAAEEVIKQYSGDAVELGLLVARIDAAQTSIIPLIIGLLIAWWAIAKAKWCLKKDEADTIGNPTYLLGTILFGVMAVGGSVMVISAATSLFAWVGIFYPEVWLVHKLIN